MSLQCGIVGLPNVGKSTLFNALTKAGIPAENYPFCTIEPNVGVVEVPDPRMDALAAIVKPERMVNAIVKFVRCFEDDNVIHVAGKVSPLDDIEVIQTELALADMGTVEKAIHRENKKARSGDKDAAKLVAVLERMMPHLNDAKPVRAMGLDADEMLLIKPLCLITAKPAMYVANVSDTGFKDNPLLDQLAAYAKSQNAPMVAICAAIEAEIADLDDADKGAFLADMGMEEPGLDRLIRAAYNLLGLQTYFTAGVKEVRAWTIHIGDTAPQAAGVIHTDFERGFIRAQTIAYDDYVQYKGEGGAKEAGKMRAEGKEYVVKDGDVLNFLFNV